MKIRCPFKVPDDHSMAIELVEESLKNKSGLVQYLFHFSRS
jgi:predicted N-acetyltransferase YhbS